MDGWAKLETLSKVIAAIFIPVAIAWMGNQLSAFNKQKDTETKLIELATTILTKDSGPNPSEETKHLRNWAVGVINVYSGVPMNDTTKDALVSGSISLPAKQLENQTTDAAGTWGVVFGGDKTLEEAQYEIKHTAKSVGVNKAQIFLRSAAYRSVAVYTSRTEAEDALGKLKTVRSSSYIVDMTKWCPNTNISKDYYECIIK